MHIDKKLNQTLSSFDVRIGSAIDLIASSSVLDDRAGKLLNNRLLNNTNVEGYPGGEGSFYGTAELSDPIQQLAIDRAKEAFHCQFANVQCYSTSIANLAVITALRDYLHPDSPDKKLKIFSLDTAFGGHFTHGQPDHLTSRFSETSSIPLAENGTIDLVALDNKLSDKKPDVLLVGGSSNTTHYDFKELKECCQKHQVRLWVDASHHAGYMIAGQYPRPFPHADIVTCSLHKSLPGPRTGLILCNNRSLAEHIDRAVYPGIQGEPNLASIAATAYVLEAAMKNDDYKQIARDTYKNAKALAKGLQSSGIRLIGNGTQTHLVMADMSGTKVSGREAALFLKKIGILCNQMPLPSDQAGEITSTDHMHGLRFGTYAITWHGLDTRRAETLGKQIGDVLQEYIAAKKECGTDEALLKQKSDAIVERYGPLLRSLRFSGIASSR